LISYRVENARHSYGRQREIFFQVWFGEKLEDYEQKWRNKIAKAEAEAQAQAKAKAEAEAQAQAKAKAEAEAKAEARTIQAIENLLHETDFTPEKIADILGITKKQVLTVKKRVDKK